MGKVMIVAELSANHGGSLQTALETVRAAKRAGVDAVKLQTYTADTLTLDCDAPDFIINNGSIWDGCRYYDLYKKAYTPWEWHKPLFELAKKEGLQCFSTPFDKTAVDFLESLGNPIYKIASFEITDIPLIEYAARKMKPMVISTGIATMEDIELAIETCRSVGNNDITLLKCTSSYPAPIEEANLCMIKDFSERFHVKAGLSDHTLGSVAPIVATSLGAVMIEKHFIINREIGGPDSSFSMDESEFTQMVRDVRMAEAAFANVFGAAEFSGHICGSVCTFFSCFCRRVQKHFNAAFGFGNSAYCRVKSIYQSFVAHFGFAYVHKIFFSLSEHALKLNFRQLLLVINAVCHAGKNCTPKRAAAACVNAHKRVANAFQEKVHGGNGSIVAVRF